MSLLIVRNLLDCDFKIPSKVCLGWKDLYATIHALNLKLTSVICTLLFLINYVQPLTFCNIGTSLQVFVLHCLDRFGKELSWHVHIWCMIGWITWLLENMEFKQDFNYEPINDLKIGSLDKTHWCYVIWCFVALYIFCLIGEITFRFCHWWLETPLLPFDDYITIFFHRYDLSTCTKPVIHGCLICERQLRNMAETFL